MGAIVTFYSYKGGVGRSFALANVAASLATWGFRVLCVDWDLEAPGLHYYFADFLTPGGDGLVQMIMKCGATAPPSAGLSPEKAELASLAFGADWRDYVRPIQLPGAAGSLGLIAAGAEHPRYLADLQQIRWPEYFAERKLGTYLELLREEWREAYDFILVDSRTGVTDTAGICTIQLPDILVFLFTANRQSLDGAVNAVSEICRSRAALPVPRPAVLLTLPVAARFDMTEEYDVAKGWKEKFAASLQPFYEDWAPMNAPGVDSHALIRSLIDRTTVPYFAKWSFGELLPALVERGPVDTKLASFYLNTIAALIAHEFENAPLLVESAEKYIDAARRAAARKSTPHYDLFIAYAPPQQADAKIVVQLMQTQELHVFDGGAELAGGEANQALSLSQHLVYMPGAEHDPRSENQALQFIKQALDDRVSRRVLTVSSADDSDGGPSWLLSSENYLRQPHETGRTLGLRLMGALGLNRRVPTIATLRGHTDVILRVSWEPSGKRVVTGSVDRTARIWDPRSGAPLATLSGHQYGVNRAAWLDSGELLATCSFDRNVRIWDTQTWGCVQQFVAHMSDVRSIDWAPGGEHLATCSAGGSITLWAASGWKRLRTFRGHAGGVNRVVWLDSRRLCSASDDGTVRLWDFENETALQTFAGHSGAVWDVAYSAQRNLLASASSDRTVRIWQPDAENSIHTLMTHTRPVRSVSFAADGRLLAYEAEDGWLCIAETSGFEICAFLKEKPSNYWPCGGAFAPHAPLLASLADRDRIVQVRDCSQVAR